MNGLNVTPDKFLSRIVRSAILAGHSDREINEMIHKYTEPINMELINTKIDERV